MRDERTKLLTFVITWMDGLPSNLDKFWQKWRISSRGEEENKEERKGGRSKIGWTKGLYRATFSTGSWHEPVLKVDIHKPFVHPSHSVLPLFPHFLCSSPLFLELLTNFAQNLSRFEGPHPFK